MTLKGGAHSLGHRDLVVGDGKPALGDVEDPGGRPAVVGRVVQDAVGQAVAAQQRRGEPVSSSRQRQLPGQPGLVQDERAARQVRRHVRVGW